MKIAVIGSGVGGMICAAAMAKRGHTVTVFEQHSKIGGYCHSFRRGDFVFQAPVQTFHSVIYEYLKNIDIEYPELERIPFKLKYCFENKYQITMTEHLDHVFMLEFPDKTDKIKAFYKEIEDSHRIFTEFLYYDKNIMKLKTKDMLQLCSFMKISVIDLLNKHFPEKQDEEIKNVLLGITDLSSDMSALLMPFTLMENKNKSNQEIMIGGVERMIYDLESIVLKAGGNTKCNTKIEKIIVSDGKVVEIKTKNESYKDFDSVVLASDIYQFYEKMLEGVSIDQKNKALKQLQSYRDSDSNYTVWLGLDCSPEELELSHTLNYYPDLSKVAWKRDYFDNNPEAKLSKESVSVVISPTSSFDNTCTPTGKSQVCIGINLPYNIENRWYENEVNQQIYYERKKEINELLIDTAEQIIPGIRSHIKVIESATPRTHKRYTLNKAGATLGYAYTSNYIMGTNRPTSKMKNVENLYFSSNWVSDFSGIIGSVDIGFKTANVMLKDSREEPYIIPKDGEQFGL